MPINRLLAPTSLEPDEVRRLNKAFKDALHALQLVRRDHDPLTEFIAKQVVEIGQTGVRDLAQISELAVKRTSQAIGHRVGVI